VKDTGIGMNQSFIDNGLFQEFEQEEKMIGNQRGLGLGMSLSKYMIGNYSLIISINLYRCNEW
jgi:K+-sensing histidine kinase KdpD